jgi:hypothetical protein
MNMALGRSMFLAQWEGVPHKNEQRAKARGAGVYGFVTMTTRRLENPRILILQQHLGEDRYQ